MIWLWLLLIMLGLFSFWSYVQSYRHYYRPLLREIYLNLTASGVMFMGLVLLFILRHYLTYQEPMEGVLLSQLS